MSWNVGRGKIYVVNSEGASYHLCCNYGNSRTSMLPSGRPNLRYKLLSSSCSRFKINRGRDRSAKSPPAYRRANPGLSAKCCSVSFRSPGGSCPQGGSDREGTTELQNGGSQFFRGGAAVRRSHGWLCLAHWQYD